MGFCLLLQKTLLFEFRYPSQNSDLVSQLVRATQMFLVLKSLVEFKPVAQRWAFLLVPKRWTKQDLLSSNRWSSAGQFVLYVDEAAVVKPHLLWGQKSAQPLPPEDLRVEICLRSAQMVQLAAIESHLLHLLFLSFQHPLHLKVCLSNRHPLDHYLTVDRLPESSTLVSSITNPFSSSSSSGIRSSSVYLNWKKK